MEDGDADMIRDRMRDEARLEAVDAGHSVKVEGLWVPMVDKARFDELEDEHEVVVNALSQAHARVERLKEQNCMLEDAIAAAVQGFVSTIDALVEVLNEQGS